MYDLYMEINHGTATAYSHHGCRCDECRAAVRDYQRRRAQAMKSGTWVPNRNPRAGIITPCSVDGCDRPAKGQGMCGTHYLQAWRGAEVKPIRRVRRVTDGVKECSRCGETKPVAEFARKAGRGSGVTPACKACTSIINRCNKYGLSFEKMKWLLEQPCAGCGRHVTGMEQHIDHCHDTGIVRGVLCHNCNTVLTKHMTPTILRALADYLEPFESVQGLATFPAP